jgi:hypothetical protein
MISRADRATATADLARHGFRIERGALFVAFAVGAKENVLAAVDQDARFGLVARGDQIDGHNGQNERGDGRNDDPAPVALDGVAKRTQIDIAVFACSRLLRRRRRRDRRRYRSLRLFLDLAPQRITHRTLPRTPRLHQQRPPHSVQALENRQH